MEGLQKENIQGLVIEAAGGGHVSSRVADFVKEYAKSIPIMLSSRTGSGEVLNRTYAFKGSEIDLIDSGVIPAGHLSSSKARILLHLLIKNGYNLRQIQENINRWFLFE